MKTLKQLQDVAYSVFNKEKNTSLAKMFNVELKFTVDSIKNWFTKNLKQNELDFRDNNYFTPDILTPFQ